MMRRVCLIGVLMLVVTASAYAQTASSGKLSFSVSDVEISKALAALAQKAHVTILPDATVKGKVSCSLDGVTTEQALSTICSSAKLVWIRVYAVPAQDGSISPGELFKQYDALMALKSGAIICEDPKTETQVGVLPGAKPGSLDAAVVASGLKMKQVYLVRIEPEILQKAKAAKDKIEADKQQQQQQVLDANAAAQQQDPKFAADQVWNYFSSMSTEQRQQVMGALRQKFMDSMTPEQRQQLLSRFGGRRNQGQGQ